MRWIVVFNPVLVLFLMAVHKLSGDPPIDPSNQLHIDQHNHVASILNASSSNHT
jgi:hypothetical protein